MEYNKEYTFFKNVALRMQIPLREMNKKEIMFLCGADCSDEQANQGYDFKELEHLFQNSNQQDIVYLENPTEDAVIPSSTFPPIPDIGFSVGRRLMVYINNSFFPIVSDFSGFELPSRT